VDVDFIPSQNMHDILTSVDRYDSILAEPTKAFVVPAFEQLTESPVPIAKEDLLSQFHQKTVCGFHVNHFPKGHMPTGLLLSKCIYLRNRL
jgi:hypothetical protein